MSKLKLKGGKNQSMESSPPRTLVGERAHPLREVSLMEDEYAPSSGSPKSDERDIVPSRIMGIKPYLVGVPSLVRETQPLPWGSPSLMVKAQPYLCKAASWHRDPERRGRGPVPGLYFQHRALLPTLGTRYRRQSGEPLLKPLSKPSPDAPSSWPKMDLEGGPQAWEG